VTEAILNDGKDKIASPSARNDGNKVAFNSVTGNLPSPPDICSADRMVFCWLKYWLLMIPVL